MKPVGFLKQRNANGEFEYGQMQFLRAVRSDGHIFVAHAEVGPTVTPEWLRGRLDTMLHEPARLALVDESSGDGLSPLVDADFGKGTGNWVEEP
jgi:hypothetical protein